MNASCICCIAVLNIAGILMGCERDTNKKAADATSSAVEKTGNAISDAGKSISNAATQATGALAPTGATDEKGIRNLFGQLTNAATKQGKLDNVIDLFAKADRDAIKKDFDSKDEELDRQIDQFRKNWKTKYSQDFDLPEVENLYNASFVMITSGTDAPGIPGAVAAEKDRPTATASIKASPDLASVDVPLVGEAGLWKITVPATLDGARLKKNLLEAITNLNGSSTAWPTDSIEGYRTVTHAVLLAVMNKSVKSNSGIGPAT